MDWNDDRAERRWLRRMHFRPERPDVWPLVAVILGAWAVLGLLYWWLR